MVYPPSDLLAAITWHLKCQSDKINIINKDNLIVSKKPEPFIDAFAALSGRVFSSVGPIEMYQ
jgi:hypothetical protein